MRGQESGAGRTVPPALDLNFRPVEFSFTFPDGTRVVDDVLGISYIVGAIDIEPAAEGDQTGSADTTQRTVSGKAPGHDEASARSTRALSPAMTDRAQAVDESPEGPSSPRHGLLVIGGLLLLSVGALAAVPMLDAYDFSVFRTVADIGGGNGRMLAAILNRHPAVEGILFDLPAVADRSRTIISRLGLSERCRIVEGDFFTSVPAADAYILRHILHDWDDAEAATILRNRRQALNPEGRVLVVEAVIPLLDTPCFGKWLDLMMLIVGGRERTQEQYQDLFAQAGLKLSRIVPTAHEVSIVEGVRAD